MTAIRIAIVAAICATVATPAVAQLDTAVIAGVIRGESGVTLEGATVTVRSVATGFRRTVATGADGQFVVAGVPAEGICELTVELAGFVPAHVDVDVHQNERLTVTVSLSVAATETVTVKRTVEAVSATGESTLRQSVDETLIQSLPLFSRHFIQLASLAAGFTGSPEFPSAQGQMYWAHNVLVDGVSHFSKWRSAPRAFYSGYGLESIKEVQVLTNSFSAEFGDALASVTTALTRSGTNDWHGSALLFIRHEALNATPAFTATKPPARGQQYALSIGGPLVRDRAQFWASYEAMRVRDRNIVVSPVAAGAQVPDDQDERLAFVRVDRQQSARQSLAARYNGQFFRWHDEPGGLTVPGAGTAYTNDVHTLLITDNLQTSGRTLNESRLQFARYVDIRRDLQPTVFVSRAGYSVEGGTIGPLGFGANPEDTWEAADTLSLWRGPHSLKAGAGLRHVRSRNPSLGYGYGGYFFAGPPDSFSTPFLFVQGIPQGTVAPVAEPRSLSSWTFMQDDWAVGHNVAVNVGVRYDVERVYNVRGYSVPVDKNNLQPRVAAAWNPDGSRRLTIRGGIGLYTQQQLLYPINRVQLEGIDGIATVVVPDQSPAMPVFPGTLPMLPVGALGLPRDAYRVGARLLNPYSLQSSIGVEKALFGTTVAVDYVNLDGYDLLSLVDANAPASNIKPQQRTVAQADATRPIVPAPGSFRKIITLGNEGRSWYRALQLKTTRTAGSLHAIASYTWSRAEDMANYELPEDSRNLQADKARALTDVRHNIAGGVAWSLPGRLREWSLSGIGTFRSNPPYTISWGDDRNGTSQGDARPGDRNTGKTDPYRDIDLAVTRRFHLRTTALEARLEAFNLFNVTNYDQYVGQLASPLFGRPVSAFPARRLQLAAIVRF